MKELEKRIAEIIRDEDTLGDAEGWEEKAARRILAAPLVPSFRGDAPERFRVKKRITDSGRSKVWFVEDTWGELPLWMFNEGKSDHNHRLATEAAELLNLGSWLNE